MTQTIINKALTERPWVNVIAPGKARVIPRTLIDKRARREHGKYVLTFSWDGDLPVVETCTDERTGEECKGFKYAGHCYHQFSLIKHLVERQERKVAA